MLLVSTPIKTSKAAFDAVISSGVGFTGITAFSPKFTYSSHVVGTAKVVVACLFIRLAEGVVVPTKLFTLSFAWAIFV